MYGFWCHPGKAKVELYLCCPGSISLCVRGKSWGLRPHCATWYMVAVGSVAGVLWAKVPCVWPHAAVLLDERFPPSTQRCLDASSHVPGLGAGWGWVQLP